MILKMHTEWSQKFLNKYKTYFLISIFIFSISISNFNKYKIFKW